MATMCCVGNCARVANIRVGQQAYCDDHDPRKEVKAEEVEKVRGKRATSTKRAS